MPIPEAAAFAASPALARTLRWGLACAASVRLEHVQLDSVTDSAGRTLHFGEAANNGSGTCNARRRRRLDGAARGVDSGVGLVPGSSSVRRIIDPSSAGHTDAETSAGLTDDETSAGHTGDKNSARRMDSLAAGTALDSPFAVMGVLPVHTPPLRGSTAQSGPGRTILPHDAAPYDAEPHGNAPHQPVPHAAVPRQSVPHDAYSTAAQSAVRRLLVGSGIAARFVIPAVNEPGASIGAIVAAQQDAAAQLVRALNVSSEAASGGGPSPLLDSLSAAGFLDAYSASTGVSQADLAAVLTVVQPTVVVPSITGTASKLPSTTCSGTSSSTMTQSTARHIDNVTAGSGGSAHTNDDGDKSSVILGAGLGAAALATVIFVVTVLLLARRRRAAAKAHAQELAACGGLDGGVNGGVNDAASAAAGGSAAERVQGAPATVVAVSEVHVGAGALKPGDDADACGDPE